MPDIRELAIFFWLVVASCWILVQPKLRSGVGAALRALFQHPFLYLSLAAMAGYMAVEVWLGARLRAWNRGLLTETILWAMLTGGIMFFESNSSLRLGPRYLGARQLETFLDSVCAFEIGRQEARERIHQVFFLLQERRTDSDGRRFHIRHLQQTGRCAVNRELRSLCPRRDAEA